MKSVVILKGYSSVCLFTVPAPFHYILYDIFLTTFRKLYYWSYSEAAVQILIYMHFYCAEKHKTEEVFFT